MMNYVYDYLYNILSKQLKEFEISDDICNKVITNIKQQMLSLLQYWGDVKFRNTILAVGEEEGLFYKPNAKNEVMCFVVVTVRNSLFETLASRDYSELGAVKMIDDDKVLQITARAIEYFSGVDFDSLSEALDFTDVYNIYAEIKEKYSVAWNAIEQIGNSNKKCIRYNKTIAEIEPELLEMINQEDITVGRKSCKVELSGYDEGIDENLIGMLKNAYEEPGYILVVSCFKMITRNINKLFRIIDFILKCGGAVVTANYYITNGYAEVRRPLIKAAHGTKEAERNLDNLKGLSSKHSDILKHRPRMKLD